MIARHKGNIIKHTGDGWIAEFSSAISAAKCALALQSELSKHAESGSGADRIAYRIALHLGDLVFDEGDIYGDGDNVAARLEALAPQGGIVVSGTARDLLKNQAEFTLEDKGAHQLKNVSEPVRVYELVASERSKQHLTNRRPKHIISRRSIGAVGGAVLALVIGLMFFMESAPETHLTSEEPSIVVMPLENLSGAQDQAYFAQGLTEDITTDLSQLPELFVVSRNTARNYAKSSTDPRVVSKELDVRYVLSGSVRRVADTLRINMTLTDGQSGAQIWAERYDGKAAEVLVFQDSVIASVVTALPVRMEMAAIKEAELGSTDNPTAFDAYLKGLDQYRLRTPEGHVQAVEYLKEAVSIDPNYGRAHALLAAAYFELWDRRFWWSNLVSDFSEHRKIKQWPLEHVLEAKRNPTAMAYAVAALHLAADGKVTEMLAEAREALSLDSNDPDAHFTLSLAMLLNGNHQAALSAIEHAMSLDPYYPPATSW